MYSRLANLFVTTNNTLRGEMVRAGAWTAAYKLSSQLVIIMSGILVARFLGPEQYGVYTFAMAITGIFILFSQLGFTTYSIRQISRYKTKQQWLVLRSFLLFAIRFVLIGSVCIAILAFLIIDNFSTYQYNNVLLWALILIPVSALLRVSQSFLVGFEFASQSEFIVFFRQIIFVVLCALVLLHEQDRFVPVTVLWFQCAATVAALVLVWRYLYSNAPGELLATRGYEQSDNWLVGAMSFVMLSTMNYLNTQTDIVMLGFFRESSELAFYRVASQAAMVIGFGLQIIILLIAPKVARYYSENKMQKLQKLVTIGTRFNFLFALAVVSVLFAFSAQFIQLLFGEAYLAAQAPMYVLSVGKLLVALVGTSALILNMCGFEKTTTTILFYTAVSNVVLNLVLVPAFGALGASVATTLVVVASGFIMYLKVKSSVGVSVFAFAPIDKRS